MQAQQNSSLSTALSLLPEPSGEADEPDGSLLPGSKSTPSLNSAYQNSSGRSRAAPRLAASSVREASFRASEMYTEQMLLHCRSACHNLELFEKQWADTLAGIASESLNAMS